MNNDITQWEYKYLGANNIKELNEAGKEGWEATGNSNSNGILFKKPKKIIQHNENDYEYSR